MTDHTSDLPEIEDEVIEFDEFAILDSECELDLSIEKLDQDITKDDQLDMLVEMQGHLANAGDDVSLLNALKPALEMIDINCESNETAIEDISSLIDNVETSEEGYGKFALLGIFLLMDLVYLFIVLRNIGNYTRKTVKKLSSKELGDPNTKKFTRETKVVGYGQFSTFIMGVTKAFNVLKIDSLQKKVSVDTFKKMKDALNAAGLEFDDKGKATKASLAKLEPKEQSIKEAGWTKDKLDKCLNDLAELSKVLENYSDLEVQATAQKKTVKDIKAKGEDKAVTKDEINANKAASKKIKRSSKDAVKVLRMYLGQFKKVFSVFAK